MSKSRKKIIKKFGQDALALIAARFKVLSEPARLQLILALEQRHKNVSELVLETGMSQSNVSRHLQRLIENGVLKRERQGVEIYYSIAAKEIFTLCEHVCGGLRRSVFDKAKSLSSD